MGQRGRRSLVEQHPRRAEIEAAIRAGLSSRTIASQFGFADSQAVSRYGKKLRQQDAERRQEHAGKSDAERLAQRLDGLFSILTGHLAAVDLARNPRLDKGTLAVLSEARAVVREIANLKGLLRGPGIQIGITNNLSASASAAASQQGTSPSPDQVKLALIRGLRGHPEARDSVVAEFDKLQLQFESGTLIDGGEAEVADAEPEAPAPRRRRRRG